MEPALAAVQPATRADTPATTTAASVGARYLRNLITLPDQFHRKLWNFIEKARGNAIPAVPLDGPPPHHIFAGYVHCTHDNAPPTASALNVGVNA
jgi:hypothetical protein